MTNQDTNSAEDLRQLLPKNVTPSCGDPWPLWPEDLDAPHASNTGGTMRHTPPQTLEKLQSPKTPKNPPPMAKGGEDYWQGCMYVKWEKPIFEALTAKLQASQDEAKELGGDLAMGRLPSGSFEDPDQDVYGVYSHGTATGVRCKWLLFWQGIKIGIANNPDYIESQPNIWVDCSGVPTMMLGLHGAHQSVLAFLRVLGAEIASTSRPSRVDLAVDFPGVDVHPLVENWKDHQYICPSKTGNPWREGERWTGFVHGTTIRLNCYDKRLELLTKSPHKIAWTVENRYGGEFPEHAMRVEFTVNGDVLKKRFGCETMEDYFPNRAMIAHYLVNDWFRMVQPFDRKNRNYTRASNLPIWDTIAKGFQDVYGISAQQYQARPKSLAHDMATIKSMIAGCSTTLAINNGCTPEEAVLTALRDLHADVQEQMTRKASQYRLRSPAVPPMESGNETAV